MAEDLPPPPIPPDVSTDGNDWFPLHHQKLLRSRWWRGASDLARSRNVDMWCTAFTETPAGSLPDDDVELADAAGFGRDVTAFRACKSELLEPWTLCSDGRWYHPTVAVVALDTWERTAKRRSNERGRMAARRARIKAQMGARQGAPENAPQTETEENQAEGANRDAMSRVTVTDVTRDIATHNKTGQDKDYSVASDDAPGRGEPWKTDKPFLALWKAATPEMRRRAKSMRVAWGEWVKARKTSDPADILAGLRGYLRDDPDVSRTGGPGLHLWLKSRAYEQYAGAGDGAAKWTAEEWAAAVSLWRESGRWGESLGPEPGKPGCRAPAAVLALAGVGVALSVVNGGAA